MVKRRIKLNVRMAVLLAAAAVLVTSIQTPVSAINNSVNTLKVSPVRSDISVKPGDRKVVQTTVTNLTNDEIKIRPLENDFISGDESGTPALILDESQYAPTHSLKRFLSPLSDFTIPARESKTINVVINVPKDAQAGGYFGAIRFAPADPSGGGQVNLSASVASLILLTVPGDFVEKLDLTSFDVTQDGDPGGFFSSSNDLGVSFRFQNQGNVQVGPFGKISVTSGDKLVYDVDFNNKEQRDMVLPDGARRWGIPLKKIGSFGRYTVTATFTYGKKNETIQVERTFWVVPTAVIVASVGAVLALIALIFGIRAFLRSYKKRVLRGGGGGRGYRR